MKLSLTVPRYYRVKKGQTLWKIADAFELPPRLLAAHNGLTGEVTAGMVLEIPPREGNYYIVRGGESKTLLCGSPAGFEEKNKTACLYVGQRILL